MVTRTDLRGIEGGDIRIASRAAADLVDCVRDSGGIEPSGARLAEDIDDMGGLDEPEVRDEHGLPRASPPIQSAPGLQSTQREP